MYVVSTVHLNRNQLENGVFHVLATAPSSPVVGQFYYDTSIGSPRFYTGTTWDLKATDSALLGGNNAAYYLNRTNHTGTQTASTISDLATTVKAYKLNEFAAPTANIPMNSFLFTGLATPTAAGQSAEYQWVLNQISSAISGGIKAVKDPVRVLYASNQTLSGIPTSGNSDGITLSAGDRVLLTGQTAGAENGIWLVQSGSWTRPVDFDASNEIEPGTEVLVNEGTTYGGSIWRITTTGTLTLGTTALTWSQVNKLNTYTNGNGLALTGTVFSVQVVASGGITVSASGVAVDRTKVPMLFAQTIGDGSATSFTITHNLNTQDVIVSVRDTSTNNIVEPDKQAPTVNTVVITFGGTAPAANAYRVTVHG